MFKKGEKIKIYCNQCSSVTIHDVIEGNVLEYADCDEPFQQAYFICKCQECSDVAFVAELIYYSENVFNSEINDVVMFPKRTFYPPRMKRKEPEWVSCLDDDVETVLREAYRALNNELPLLAAMGVRAALEIAMINLVGDNGSFGKNIDKFIEEGHAGKKLKETIESTLDVLNDVFEVAEGVLKSTLLPSYGARIKKKTPPRPPKGTTKSS